jgi:hypothetical protein
VLFPYHWTPEEDLVEIKQLASGEQEELPLGTWCARRRPSA